MCNVGFGGRVPTFEDDSLFEHNIERKRAEDMSAFLSALRKRGSTRNEGSEMELEEVVATLKTVVLKYKIKDADAVVERLEHFIKDYAETKEALDAARSKEGTDARVTRLKREYEESLRHLREFVEQALDQFGVGDVESQIDVRLLADKFGEAMGLIADLEERVGNLISAFETRLGVVENEIVVLKAENETMRRLFRVRQFTVVVERRIVWKAFNGRPPRKFRNKTLFEMITMVEDEDDHTMSPNQRAAFLRTMNVYFPNVVDVDKHVLNVVKRLKRGANKRAHPRDAAEDVTVEVANATPGARRVVDAARVLNEDPMFAETKGFLREPDDDDDEDEVV